MAGASLGACQSATRTIVGLMSPLSRAAEFFGFWGISLKLLGVFGVLGIGLLQALFGLHTAILFCLVLFAIAWMVSWRVNEARGRAVAEREEGESYDDRKRRISEVRLIARP